MTPEQLKASILQRAMEGKLVPQDPNDEPASVLLKRIKKEKEKLIKEGKIKHDKNETEIFRSDDGLYYEKFKDGTVKEIDVPFEIPENWEWTRFSSICTIVRGGSPRPIKEFITEAADGINWIKIGDTEKDGKYINSVKEKIKPSGLKKTRFVQKGSFLLTNSMSFGRPYILNVDGAIHDGWLAISDYETVFDRDFLYYLLSSKVAFYQFLGLISGAVVKNLNSDKVASIFVPIPPLSEQKRIVNKVEFGLSKVDVYADSYSKLEQLNKSLPEKLRKSILQYAMQGKLVPQDPNDEPVEVLLEKIRAEKKKLYKEGKIKKKDLEESIIYKGDDNSYYEKRENQQIRIDIPFDIPNTWKWRTLGQVVQTISAGGDKPTVVSAVKSEETPIPIFSNGVKANGLYGYTNEARIFKPSVTVSGRGTIGFSVIRQIPYVPIIRLISITPIENTLDLKFLNYQIQLFIPKGEGTSIPQLTVPKIFPKPFALPPVEEQKNISKLIDLLYQKILVFDQLFFSAH